MSGILFRPQLERVRTASMGNRSIKCLTHKQLETHGYVLNTAATDALVLKHQTIIIHSAD